MFHEGDLQSGITLAIQQAKLVVCFIRDDSTESSKWEKQWLLNGPLASVLAEKSVLLRIDAGSQEAGFLSAFCPITAIPTLMVIHNGQLLEQLNAGVVEEEFGNRLGKVLHEDSSSSANDSAVRTPPPSASPIPPGAVSLTGPAATSSSATSSLHAQTHSSNVDAILAERAHRLEASKQAQEEAEAAARSAKRKGKQKAVEQELEAANEDPTRKAQLSAAAQAKLSKQNERRELERVLALVEADKKERRERELRRKAAAAEEQRGVQSSIDSPPSKAAKAATKREMSKEVQLQFRLFDGSSLRSSFSRTATLRSNVRPWIDTQLSAQTLTHPPYTFKHVLVPPPSRSISISEEDSPLGELDLYPSATLVLVAIQGYTEAYSNAGGSGIIGMLHNGMSGAIGLVYDSLGLVGGAVRSLAGFGGQQRESGSETAAQQLQQPTPPSTESSRIRVRTLADQRAEKERGHTQLYNGNQLNFEPKRDSEDEG